MLALLIFAATFLLVLIAAVIWLYPGSKRVSTIPGLEPSDPKKGNLGDITKAGSLHQFLKELHEEYGSIASFWMDEEFIVSIASPELFKAHSKVFDRPGSLYKSFEPLLTPYSVQYANGGDGRRRRELYDTTYSHEAVTQNYLPIFQKTCEEFMRMFLEIPKDEHVPLEKHMFRYSLKCICEASLGKRLRENALLQRLEKSYDFCWEYIEKSADGGQHDAAALKRFEKEKDNLMEIIHEIVEERAGGKNDDTLLVDILLKSGLSKDIVAADALTYLIGGAHTSAYLLAWCLYYLAAHPDVQENCNKELKEVLGNEMLDARVVNDLKYLRQVVDETMRCSTLAPSTARFQEMDIELGGHVVPSGTPVIHALGVVLEDAEYWPEPSKFNPDRFKDPPAPYTFVPFGFAGKRKCPGYRFANIEVTVFLSNFLRKFKVKLVPGQDVQKVYSVVTKPSDEIYVTLLKR